MFMLASTWMHGHPGLFVDDDQIVVFVQNRQRNRFRFGLDLFGWWFCDFDFVSRSHRLVGSRGRAAETNKAGVDQLLNARSREFRK